MNTYFKITKATVMHFSRHPDQDGICIPPECYVRIPDEIPVIFDDADQRVIGTARVKRVGNKLVADMLVSTSMKSTTKAFGMIQRLFPGTVFATLDAYEHVILGLGLKSILLGPSPNMDAKIKQLGDTVSCLTAKTDLH